MLGAIMNNTDYEHAGRLLKELEDFIADLMIRYGPDGHCDGSDIIAANVFKWFYDTNTNLEHVSCPKCKVHGGIRKSLVWLCDCQGRKCNRHKWSQHFYGDGITKIPNLMEALDE